ncbi:MAG: hypothetical protein EXS09_13090 [Gemmataceae bacterium]|nr:hypothetical protein [Gemmataceae bacterium]
MACRNCQKSKVNRPRGLCWSCYYKPGIRQQFPSTSKFARRGLGNFCGQAVAPTCCTRAVPGSTEKIAILAERARNQQALWHPADASFSEAGIENCAHSQAC